MALKFQSQNGQEIVNKCALELYNVVILCLNRNIFVY